VTSDESNLVRFLFDVINKSVYKFVVERDSIEGLQVRVGYESKLK